MKAGLVLGAGMIVMLPGLAMAAPCSMPAALKERVCDDPELAKLDAELVHWESEVLKVTARPATWLGRAARFRSDLAIERDGDDRLIGRDELRERITYETAVAQAEVRAAATLRTSADRAAILGNRCLAGWLSMGCRVPAAGVVRDGEITILYQIQTGASEDNGVGAGVMLWDASRPGAPRFIGWTFDGVEMRMPQLNAEHGLLWVPGLMNGTGAGNADILFQKRGERWVEIDMGAWREALRARLPKVVGAWHGVDYSFDGDAMGAETDLWNEADANCCPTAGRANLSFKIEGDRLVLDGVDAQLGGPGERWKSL